MLAYFDCFSGISGDMTLAAFIDLGMPLNYLTEKIRQLGVDEIKVKVAPITRNGIRAQSLQVAYPKEATKRDYAKIRALIERSALSADVKNNSLTTFEHVAVAEAHIHGCSKDKVHFHEVGGVDAIFDIVGTALCMEYFTITDVRASKLPLGSGFVNCQHGTLPVPAPATLAILKGVPVYGGGLEGERVTPTGAALIKTYATAFGDLPALKSENIGYGAGQREDPNIPNLLRIILGTASETLDSDQVVCIETNIDDMSPEIFGYLMERFFEEGALDACFIPVQMKKNRPGVKLEVICEAHRFEALKTVLLTETSTIGIRYQTVARQKLPRELVMLDTPFGKVAAKKIHEPNGGFRVAPEYESCRQIAGAHKIPIKDVYQRILSG